MENREIKFRVWDKNERFLEEVAYPWVMIGNNSCRHRRKMERY